MLGREAGAGQRIFLPEHSARSTPSDRPALLLTPSGGRLGEDGQFPAPARREENPFQERRRNARLLATPQAAGSALRLLGPVPGVPASSSRAGPPAPCAHPRRLSSGRANNAQRGAHPAQGGCGHLLLACLGDRQVNWCGVYFASSAPQLRQCLSFP